ncbi:EAL domain-containing protein [Clostridium sp. cel8]|uniref:EAL domain-containing protein n=1 Tax=Clostridium sp. cel8 TaxID=2663123 RepID=UPI0015F55B84|nr:EAL domain-containing protein [Clostridium sp. cel8]MBA5850416.1 EAL domain-containing protein [Clostridium sp. cel8]
MEYEFSKIIESDKIRSLIKSFYELTGITCLIQYNGRLLNMLSLDNDTISLRFDNYDRDIVNQIKRGSICGIYKSKSGLLYMGIPLYVKNKVEVIIFTTPVFYKKPDIECLKVETSTLKYRRYEVSDILKSVPVYSSEYIQKIVDLLCNMFSVIQVLFNDNINWLNKNIELQKREKDFKDKYESIRKKAYYDELTNLPNWNYLKDEIQKKIDRDYYNRFVLFHIDLNNFKNINDIFGYKYGDKLLKKIGNAIKKIYENKGIVSRKHGNEFMILKPYTNLKNLNIDAKELMDTISGIWKLGENEVLISVSMGVSVYPDDGTNIVEIMRNADIALNKAKSSGKNSYKFFDKSMYDDILRKSEMEKEIRKALKYNEFILYYQPQVDIETNEMVSFEALIRWNSSKFGWVMPGEFISLAEETGLIVSIGEWVFKEACIQSTIWKKKGYKFDFISVNVSTVQLKESGFIDMVKRILLETNVDPKTIEVEITESVVIESLKKNCKIINELKKMGIRVALDDFGSGYSSLNYLKSIPINTIKIDKTFIDGICKYDYENIITGEIINLAHRMNLDVIAEGVEEEDQVNFLRTKSCNKIQGYYFGKPMPSENIDNMLRNKINI